MIKKISQEEAFMMIKNDLKRHNDTSHHEDCFCLLDWLDECVGNTYGNWKAVRSTVRTDKVILIEK